MYILKSRNLDSILRQRTFDMGLSWSLTKEYTVMPEPGGPGGPLAPPIFGRSVNPIWTGEGRLSPPITTGPLNVFHLPASLIKWRVPFKAQPCMSISRKIGRSKNLFPVPTVIYQTQQRKKKHKMQIIKIKGTKIANSVNQVLETT